MFRTRYKSYAGTEKNSILSGRFHFPNMCCRNKFMRPPEAFKLGTNLKSWWCYTSSRFITEINQKQTFSEKTHCCSHHCQVPEDANVQMSFSISLYVLASEGSIFQLRIKKIASGKFASPDNEALVLDEEFYLFKLYICVCVYFLKECWIWSWAILCLHKS